MTSWPHARTRALPDHQVPPQPQKGYFQGLVTRDLKEDNGASSEDMLKVRDHFGCCCQKAKEPHLALVQRCLVVLLSHLTLNKMMKGAQGRARAGIIQG